MPRACHKSPLDVTTLVLNKLLKSIYMECFLKLSKNVNESDPRSNVHYLGSSENKAWKKKSGLYGIWTHDLCDTGATLYQLS